MDTEPGGSTTAEEGLASGETTGAARVQAGEVAAQYLTFRIGGEAFGFPMERVREVVRLPGLTEVPLTPEPLLGLANLRGQVAPVLGGRELLALETEGPPSSPRVVVVDGASPAGLRVDQMGQVLAVRDGEVGGVDQIESAVDTELLTGVVEGRDEAEGLILLLDPDRLLAGGMGTVGGMSGASEPMGRVPGAEASGERHETAGAEPETQLVAFGLEGQEYALPVARVEEIVRAPSHFSGVPRSENHVLGIMQLRGRPLPVVSLRDLLGLPGRELGADDRLVVVSIDQGGRKANVGLVVDEVREVLRLPVSALDEVPPLLAADRSLSELEAVVRLEEGRRLLTVLAVDRLFGTEGLPESVAAQTEDPEEEEAAMTTPGTGGQQAEAQLVVFGLHKDEFGVRIEGVREITRLPGSLTHVPYAPDFIEGVVNLRGRVLPVINLRRRFGLAEAEGDNRQRILVVRLNGLEAGLLVDSVSEVLKVEAGALQPTPRLSDYQKRVMAEMVKLPEQKRLVLVLQPDELVSEQEQDEIRQVAD